MSLPPGDGTRALLESEAKRRKSLEQTDWVEAIRRELYERGTAWENSACEDEKTLITSIRKDLRLLSHNLALRRGDISKPPARDVFQFPEYHYENGNQKRD